jgi:SagB-type dehydrogenase family enzyme
MGHGSEELYEEEEHALPEVYYLLEELKQHALLSYTVMEKGEPLIMLIPLGKRALQLRETKVDPKQPLHLSRFVYLRAVPQGLSIKSPLIAAAGLVTHSKSLEILHALAAPISLEGLVQKFPQVAEETLSSFVSLLRQASFLSDVDQAPALRCWEFHDLLLHTQSRKRNQQPIGATFRFLDQVPSLPSLREVPAELIPLFKPDLGALSFSDPSFTDVMERRQSIRIQGKTPLSKELLGEFLYRAARVKRQIKAQHYEATHRPYPGGGACHELELYPLIHRCEGLESGLYRYHPDVHALHPCPITVEEQERLLLDAAGATGTTELPQILILITARFERVSWKYEAIAYSLILKDTGALLQTLYLVATAMDLAPCAVGAGDSDLFAQAVGTDYYTETTVGEFILGTKGV